MIQIYLFSILEAVKNLLLNLATSANTYILINQITAHHYIMDRKGRQIKVRDSNELFLAIKYKQIYETTYQAISISNMPLLKKLIDIDDDINTSFLHQLIRSSPILWELENIFNPLYHLTAAKFDEIMEALVAIFNQQYQHIFNAMKQQEKNIYSCALALNHQLQDIKKNKKVNPTHKNQNSDLSLEKLFKVDILSVFLKKNQDCHNTYQIRNALLTKKFLTKLLKIDEKEYEGYSSKFEKHAKYITFKYKDQLQDIITLILLIEIKSRISTINKNFSKERLEKIQRQVFQSDSSQQNNIIKQEYIQQELNLFQFRLCELISLSTTPRAIEKTSYKTQAKIAQKLTNIVQQNEMKIQHQILKITVQLNVAVSSIQKWYLRSKTNTKLRTTIIKQIQEELKKLTACQWYFLKKTDIGRLVKEILPTISQGSFHQCSNYDPVLTFLCRLIVERCRFYSTVLIAQKRIERYLLIPSLYACKFQYRYRDTQCDTAQNFHENSSNRFKKNASLIATVIILTNAVNVVMTAITQDRIHNDTYWKLLDSYFKAKMIQHTNLSIFQLSFDRAFGDRSLKQCTNAFMTSYNSHVYISNSPHQFQLHFAVNAYITTGLATKKPSIQTFHTTIQNEAMKILTILQSSQLYPKDLFTQHSIKEALHPQYDNFHLEFKQQEKREEAVRFFRYIFQDPKYYHAKQCYKTYWKSEIKKPQLGISRLKFCIFNNKRYFEESHIKDLNEEDMKEFKQRQVAFSNHFASQMKWRHTYLSLEEMDSIREDLHQFMNQHHLKSNKIKAILEDVVRNLLVYQAYFHDIIHDSALNYAQQQLMKDCQKEIQFLARIYQLQNYHIDELLPGFREQFFTTYIKRQLYQGMVLKLQIDELIKGSRPYQQQRKQMKMLKVEQSILQPEYYVSQNNLQRQQQHQQQNVQPSYKINAERQLYLKSRQFGSSPNDEKQFTQKVNAEEKIYQHFEQNECNYPNDQNHSACKAIFAGKLCQKSRQFDCNDEEEEEECEQPKQYIYNANAEDSRIVKVISLNFSNENNDA